MRTFNQKQLSDVLKEHCAHNDINRNGTLIIWCGSNNSLDALKRELKKLGGFDCSLKSTNDTKNNMSIPYIHKYPNQMDSIQDAESYSREMQTPVICLVNDYSLQQPCSCRKIFSWGDSFETTEDLAKNLPEHLVSDFENAAFVPNPSMWGEVFDRTKGSYKVFEDFVVKKLYGHYVDPYWLRVLYESYCEVLETPEYDTPELKMLTLACKIQCDEIVDLFVDYLKESGKTL